MSEDIVRAEAEKTALIAASGLPTPATHDRLVLAERHGIVYDRVEGPTMLDLLQTRPHRFVGYARLLAEMQLKLHAKSLTGLESRRSQMIEAIGRVHDVPAEARQQALDDLAALPDGEQLLHGDFHPDNIIMSAQGPVIIDWPDARVGAPLADVARTSLLLMVGEPEGRVMGLLINLLRSQFLRIYQKTYLNGAAKSRASLERWQLPTLMIRLTEGIEAERARVLALAQQYLASR